MRLRLLGFVFVASSCGLAVTPFLIQGKRKGEYGYMPCDSPGTPEDIFFRIALASSTCFKGARIRTGGSFAKEDRYVHILEKCVEDELEPEARHFKRGNFLTATENKADGEREYHFFEPEMWLMPGWKIDYRLKCGTKELSLVFDSDKVRTSFVGLAFEDVKKDTRIGGTGGLLQYSYKAPMALMGPWQAVLKVNHVRGGTNALEDSLPWELFVKANVNGVFKMTPKCIHKRK